MIKIVKFTITVSALIYISYDLNFKELYNSFLEFNMFGIFLTLIINMFSFILVAYRWRFLSKNICSLKASIESTFICLGVNNITPAKLGEVAKGFYLKQFYGYFIAKSFALMIIERVFDVIILISLLIFISYYIEVSNIFLLTLFIVFSLLLLTLFLLKPKLFLKFTLKYSPKIVKNFLVNVIKTIARVEFKEWLVISLYTILLWSIYYLATFIFTKIASNFELDYFQILVVFIFSSIGMALPSTPGGIGVFEAGVVFALSLYGIEKEEALSFGLILHMLQYIPTTLIAIFIINRKDFNFRKSFEN